MNLTDIPGSERFTKILPLNKGWSSDKKFYIETHDGDKLLLRISGIDTYDAKKAEFKNMKRVDALGIPMSHPLDCGVCDDGQSVYTLLSWIDGEDAKQILPLLSETEQYALGLQAGEILRKMQTIETLPPSSDWFNSYGIKLDRYICNYKNCGMTFEGDEAVIAYIEHNRHLMDNRSMCLTHDDYHVENLILSTDNKLFVIDFNRLRFVEPYKAFSGIVFSAKTSPHFATGQIRGYFGGDPHNDSMNPPIEFWQLLSLYMAAIAINGLPWSIPYGQEEIEFGRHQIEDIMRWYDGFKNVVPTWYLKDFYIQYIDGVPLKLKVPFDLSFMAKYGKVFKVFDDQDSGNLCFGTEKNGKRYFVKFAGAPTAGYDGNISDTIARLTPAAPIYRDLEHPNLIRFISAEEIGGGYAVVFDWTDAVGIGRMYPLAHKRFVALPLETRMKVFDEILAFHDHVTQCGYVAIDFYDGTIMYDFDTGKTIICDVDFYQKSPYYGDMGIWGSSKFVSPEECVVGERMDEITTVYTMGATAFALLSEFNRSQEAWKLSDKSYTVVKKATSDNRAKRQQSVRQFIEEWKAAK